MSKPRRGTEQVFYDTFADWPAEDQAAALKVLEALHRQTERQTRRRIEPGAVPGNDDERPARTLFQPRSGPGPEDQNT